MHDEDLSKSLRLLAEIPLLKIIYNRNMVNVFVGLNPMLVLHLSRASLYL